MYGIDNRRFNCIDCLKSHRKHQNGEAMRQKERDAKFCKTEAASYVHKIKDNIFFKSCIGNYYSQSVIMMMNAYLYFDQQGVLPFPGSLMEQPNKAIEVFNVMSQIKTDKMKAKEMADKMAMGALNGRRRKV